LALRDDGVNTHETRMNKGRSRIYRGLAHFARKRMVMQKSFCKVLQTWQPMLTATVRLQQQLVASGDFQLPFLSHIKAGAACTQWENTFGTVRALDFQGVIFDGNHRDGFIFGKTGFLAGET
jgi:hypothetical protein